MKAARLAEVWGDTVDTRHLSASVVIGICISVGAFFIANRLLNAYVHEPAMARAYAMLVGLAGCLIAGAVCAVLFPPKREVVEHETDASWRDEVLAQLAAESGGLGSVADLPPSVVKELKELELYQVFADAEKKYGSGKVTSRPDLGVERNARLSEVDTFKGH
jgi:hypothetical protein